MVPGTRLKVTSSDRYCYHNDHLGSSTAMTDASGTKAETTEYMPFGHQREHTGTVISNYKFTDQELDPETGLYNYDARLYDPVIGRFITADSIVTAPFDPQTLNRYSYVKNNPLIYVDPTGHGLGGPGGGGYRGPDNDIDRGDSGRDGDNDRSDSGRDGMEGGVTIGRKPSPINLKGTPPSNTTNSNKHTILGVYKRPKIPGYYRDDPLIYHDIDININLINALVGGLTPGYGIATTVTSGKIAEGSKAIAVYGKDENTPTSWEAYSYEKTGEDPVHGWDTYGWEKMNEDEALQLDITQEAIDHFNSRK